MNYTPNATILLAILDKGGASPYDVIKGAPDTTKIARRSLRNAVPIVVQTNCKTPVIWLLPEHERGAFRSLGSMEYYKAGRGRHHHLKQVREFRDRDLVKISIEHMNWREIEGAVDAISR